MKRETIIAKSRRGSVDALVRRVAAAEGLSAEEVCRGVAAGRIVLARPGRGRGGRAAGIGSGMKVKVNANLGTSRARPALKGELKKLEAAVGAGADTVMDLSTGGNLDGIRRAVTNASPVPVGTVPVYQAAVETLRRYPGRIDRMSPDGLFEAIDRHGREGIAFVTVHCGLTLESLERVRRQGRVLGIVSRGGAFLAEWMILRGTENPLYEEFDRLLEIAARHDLILSLGDALRPGCIEDATDRGQVQELIVLGELTKRAWEAGVQVIIEGPGHVPLDQIEANMILQKRLCHNAPFYVLGPLVTDSAPGYDHITSAIGGAVAAWRGADFLCYVTPSEHLGLPTVGDVRLGVVTSRVAAHAADVARRNPLALARDRRMAECRRALDWEGQQGAALDPAPLQAMRRRGKLPAGDVCTMCGPYCSIKGMKDLLSLPGGGRGRSPGEAKKESRSPGPRRRRSGGL